MITLLVIEDERRVYDLLSSALKEQGYSFVDQPQSGGVIKLIKKTRMCRKTLIGERMLEFKNILLQEKGVQLYHSTIEDIEKTLIESALERADGNQVKAARILGINRNTLRTKVKKFAIRSEQWRT